DKMPTIGGCDSHTLARVGTTYTEVPGSSVREFLQNLRAGLGRVSGRHGCATQEAREIYGVVVKYWASLIGLGRPDLPWLRRALGLTFSIVSLPCEFTPLVVAVI